MGKTALIRMYSVKTAAPGCRNCPQEQTEKFHPCFSRLLCRSSCHNCCCYLLHRYEPRSLRGVPTSRNQPGRILQGACFCCCSVRVPSFHRGEVSFLQNLLRGQLSGKHYFAKFTFHKKQRDLPDSFRLCRQLYRNCLRWLLQNYI